MLSTHAGVYVPSPPPTLVLFTPAGLAVDEDAEPDAEEDVDNVDEDFYAPDSDSELAAAPAFGGGSESATCQPLALFLATDPPFVPV